MQACPILSLQQCTLVAAHTVFDWMSHSVRPAHVNIHTTSGKRLYRYPIEAIHQREILGGYDSLTLVAGS